MSSYRQAIIAIRHGETVTRAGRTYRFLTAKEAEPIFLERMPRRSVRVDEDDKVVHDAKGAPIVDVHAPTNLDPKILGIYVLDGGHVTEFKPSDEDIAADDWLLPGEESPPVDATLYADGGASAPIE